jgi:plastocyanin
MNKNKIDKAGSICLLAFLFLVGCNNQPDQAVTTPPGNIPDSSQIDSVSSTTAPQGNEHIHTIEISKMKFNPEELTVHAGDTVVWINNDMTNHCITEANKEWTSSTLVPGQSFKKAITKNVEYYCAIHMVMKGKILVQ